MNNDIFEILFMLHLLITAIVILIRISVRIRKHGGSLTTTMFASTYEFLNKDKRESAKEIIEMNANKKTQEQFNEKSCDDLE